MTPDYAVERSALVVRIADAVDLAKKSIADSRTLNRRRCDLEQLSRLLSEKVRQLDKVPRLLPPQANRAIYGGVEPDPSGASD
jgi:hypothetical protein